MHELSLAESMIQIIEEAAHTQHFEQVRTIWVEIGHLACVELDALRFCFQSVAHNTVAQHAHLEIIDIPGTGFCLECGHHYSVKNLLEACPACGGYAIQITGGTDMRIKHLDVI